MISRHGPDRLGHGQDPAVAIGGNAVAPVDTNRLLREPAQELGGIDDLRARLGERLAHLEGHEERQVVGAFDDRLEGPAEDLAALARGVGGPLRTGLDGSVERGYGVLGGGVCDLNQLLAGGRILDRKRSVLTISPFPADKQLMRDRFKNATFVAGNDRAHQ